MSVLGMHPSALNPVYTANLYKKIIIPSILYGCELWNGMSLSDKSILLRTQHDIVKKLQGFPTRTRSDICESMVGLTTIETEIEIRKLLFLHTILNLPSEALSRQIFMRRYSYRLFNPSSKMFGFIPDICGILQKYNLVEAMNAYVADPRSLPSRLSWKYSVKTCVYSMENYLWRQRLEQDPDFYLFRQIKLSQEPSIVWTLASTKPERYIAHTVARAWTRTPHISEGYTCTCNSMPPYSDILWHIISSCQDLENERYRFLCNVELYCGSDIRRFLEAASNDDFVVHLLTGSCFDKRITSAFMKLASNFVFICVKHLDWF